MLLCFRHEKDALKRYVQRAEDSVETLCCLGRKLYDLFPYCLIQYSPELSPDFHKSLLLIKRGMDNLSYLLSVPPFVECPTRHRLTLFIKITGF
ncbi:hypothetical protein LINGRAHAP2_LOCUS28679 [Linum grandiflorum]